MPPIPPTIPWTAKRFTWEAPFNCQEKSCNNKAQHHDCENPDGIIRSYCSEHAEIYLWWYSYLPSPKPEWAS